MQQAFSNIFISGQVGSAKTTGVGAHLALGFLSHFSRPAAWIACQKPDEAERWLWYAKLTGRLMDVIHFRLGGKWTIDLLDHEVTTYGGGIESGQSMMGVLMEIGNRNRQRNSSDSYWPESSERQIGYALTILNRAGESCGLLQLLRFCASLPKT